MCSKRVTVGRGVGGTCTLAEHREAYTDDFGVESDALRPGTCVFWSKEILKVLTYSVARSVCPSGQIVENVMLDPDPFARRPREH